MSPPRIVVVGASAGGVRALRHLASALPPDFPAPILVVQHIGSHPSVLPGLLSSQGPLAAVHAAEGDAIEPGRILVAPPDRHMLVGAGRVHLSRGSKENHARPAIDPLFRSAAVEHGPAVIGVLLTGGMDDGTAGLQAIKRAGGTAVVQDPDEAESPSMPRSALRYVEVDHVATLDSLGPLLSMLVMRPAGPALAAPPRERREVDILARKGDPLENLKAIGRPSTFTCPECSGTLWELADTHPRRYRCHTGHAFTQRALRQSQAEATDQALWGALRALQEKEELLEGMAGGHGDVEESSRLLAQARRVGAHAATLRGLIEGMPGPLE